MMARDYVKNIKDVSDVNQDAQVVKIQKLMIPIFELELRKYLKWKETFQRYAANLSDNIPKVSHSVSNMNLYEEAIKQLDKEYRNKNLIMTLLIDDVKALP